MMKEKTLKYIFFITSAILLIMMVLTSRDAGITCDEVLHYNQSVSVYNYFASHGTDQSALNTPVTHLKYYGQSYDNIVTILIKWFKIDNVYRFRHFMSSIAGWLTILVTALFAIWLTDYRAGIIVLILYAVSPTFIGHTQNNLKDIPFALAYISATWFILRFLKSGRENRMSDILLLTLSIAFSLSIRAGGLILMCYLLFFFSFYYFVRYLREKKVDFTEISGKLKWIAGILAVSWLLSTLLWPFALLSPVKNVIESYRVMAHFPDTFRQIFEGKVEWSDFMPWYYIPKSMLITIPFIVLAGLILFCVFAKASFRKENQVLFLFIVFTVLFPLVFVVYEKSNVYSSWRQFLFLYPAIVLLASIGFYNFFRGVKTRYLKWGMVVLMTFFSINPLRFMISNHPYYYLYYNQLVGGTEGAYTNYEMDYYFVSQTEASRWLIDYLKEKNIQEPIKVKATYSVLWQFRKHPEIKTSFFRYEERSEYDWDYAIVVNRYISPYKLRHNFWPPKNAIDVIYVDKVPVCSILERKSKDDYYGYVALSEGRNRDAIKYFEKALKNDDRDEMIFYNFGAALYNDGQYQKADSVLKRGLELNPEFEPLLMYLGNIARSQNKTGDAINYYERLIGVNRKYFEAYVSLSALLTPGDVMKARSLLRTCLDMNPRYKPAIMALADTYRNTDPGIARKYDDLAKSIK
jgi:tetratricopeptide (TPR) repeat protein